MPVCHSTYMEVGGKSGRWFSPPNIVVLGIEFRWPGLAADGFSH